MPSKRNKKSPRGIRPHHGFPPPPPGGVKYDTVTQGKSPCLCSERHDEYLFGRAKTRGLGQVTTKKENHGKKMGITRPRPDGRVKKGGKKSKRSGEERKQKVKDEGAAKLS